MSFGPFASESSSTTTTTTQNAGFSEIGGDAHSLNLSTAGKKSQQIVNLLDAGAINSAFGFAGDALERSLRQVEMAGSSSAAAVGNAIKAVSESARTETENVILQGGKWLVVAVIAVAGFYALGKMKG